MSTNILYEVFHYVQWILDYEVQYEEEKPPKTLVGYLRKYLHWHRYSEIEKYISFQLPWFIAVHDSKGKFLAVLQDEALEIRSSTNHYDTLLGKSAVPYDEFPRFRKLIWNPDGSLVLVSLSDGSIICYDIRGNIRFTINTVNKCSKYYLGAVDRALSSLMFLEARVKTENWPYEILTINYTGELKCYQVSSSNEFKENHTFVFGNSLPVSCAEFDHAHNVLIIAFPVRCNTKHIVGLSTWRVLSDYPYYKLSSPTKEELHAFRCTDHIISRIYNREKSIIVSMKISPECDLIGCIHSCGTISVWHLPSLRLFKMFTVEYSSSEKDEKQTLPFPLDISWSPTKKLIVATQNGSVCVYDIETMQRVLYDDSVFSSNTIRLCNICDISKGLLILECREKAYQQRDLHGSSDFVVVNEKKEKAVIKQDLNLGWFRNLIWYLSNIKKIREVEKKPIRLLQKTYQIHGLKSMSPEEYYTKMIDNEKYEEALIFAQEHNLEKNRVYQRMWRNSPVSEELIKSCLANITDTAWILHECCERLPETLPAAKMLLEFGLQLTDFEAFVNYGNKEETEELSTSQCVHIDERNIDFTEEQLHILQMRKILLKYSDRLRIYEMILDKDGTGYDKEKYDKIRLGSPVDVAIMYARSANHAVVELLFEYYGSDILPHWLEVLDNFPETMPPALYKHLLPKRDETGRIGVIQNKLWRDEDWSEGSNLKIYAKSENDMDDSVNTVVDLETVFLWYKERIKYIEKKSGLVEHSLELLTVAREFGVPDLDVLYHNLMVLATMVFSLGFEDVTMSDIEKKNNTEKLMLLMSNSTSSNFVAEFRNKAIPFLDRCEKLLGESRSNILRSYVCAVSERDLTLTYLLFAHAKDHSEEIFANEKEQLNLALDCLYSSTNVEQISVAFDILDMLPIKRFDEQDLAIIELHDRLDILEYELQAVELLQSYEIEETLKSLHEKKGNVDIAKSIFLEMSQFKKERSPNAEGLEELLKHILWLRDVVFTSISEDTCREIYAFSLLTSTECNLISLAASVLSQVSSSQDNKLSYDRSVQLVLEAARQHFNCSTHYQDKTMKAASTCLNLIMEYNTEIEEEVDMIEALKHLHSFGIAMLPFKVRGIDNKMKLIDLCLEKSRYAYKNFDKLLKLAACLHLQGSDRKLRHSLVLSRAAEVAFKVKDYSWCGKLCTLCSKLPGDDYAVGWEICKKLCECENYQDISTKQQLIKFCLLHCSSFHILDLLRIRNKLEYSVLQREVLDAAAKINPQEGAVTAEDNKEESNIPTVKSVDSFVKLLKNFATPTVDLLSLNWKDALGLREGRDASIVLHKNEGCMRQGFPNFYSDLHKHCASCYVCTDLNRISRHERPDFVLRLFRYYVLHSKVHEAASQDTELELSKLISQCAVSLLSEDSFQALCYLLLLSDFECIEEYFSMLPDTLVAKKLVFLYYVLKYGFQKKLISSKQISDYTPMQIVEELYRLAESEDTDLAKRIVSCRKQVENFSNISQFQHLNCGIDADRYFSDESYRADSILGLAMSTEKDNFNMAIKLAADSNIPCEEVINSHLTFLFINAEYSILTEKLTDRNFLDMLTKSAVSVKQKLKGDIYNSLFGFNHQLMLAFYNLLNQIQEDSEIFHHLTCKEHVKLLKKVKATSDCIDYKLLTEEPPKVLEAVTPALMSDTVPAIVKFVRSLPPSIKTGITFNDIYDALVNKILTTQLNRVSPATYQLKMFEQCCEYFQSMSQEAIMNFVYEAVFSSYSYCHRDQELRKEFLNLAIDSARSSGLPYADDVTTAFVDWEQYFDALEKVYISSSIFKEFDEDWRSLVFCVVDGDEGVIDWIRRHRTNGPVPDHVLKCVIDLLLPHEILSHIWNITSR